MHVIAGKAVAFKEALDPSFKEYMTQVVKNADTLAKCTDRRRIRYRIWRNRQPLNVSRS